MDPPVTKKQTCPRRMTEFGTWPREENQDRWSKGHGLIGVQNDNLSCSFCGSLHPDTFMEWVEAGAEVTPTDKNYKIYVKCPIDNPRYGETKVGKTKSGGSITTVYGREAKFYFQHLSREQMERFVELYNENRLTFGYPGGFYRFPYFMAPVEASGAGEA